MSRSLAGRAVEPYAGRLGASGGTVAPNAPFYIPAKLRASFPMRRRSTLTHYPAAHARYTYDGSISILLSCIHFLAAGPTLAS